MAKTKQPTLGGFVIRPVRYLEGETVVREHPAYWRIGPTPFLIAGTLTLTSERLVWTGLWFVKSFPLDDISSVTLHHDSWPGFHGRSWSLKAKTKSLTTMFQFKPAHRIAFWGTIWRPTRQKDTAHHWMELVKYWANISG